MLLEKLHQTSYYFIIVHPGLQLPLVKKLMVELSFYLVKYILLSPSVPQQPPGQIGWPHLPSNLNFSWCLQVKSCVSHTIAQNYPQRLLPWHSLGNTSAIHFRDSSMLITVLGTTVLIYQQESGENQSFKLLSDLSLRSSASCFTG